jgi:hypothetical protein
VQTTHALQLLRALQSAQRGRTTYAQLRQSLSDTQLSAHSFRRGAATALAGAGYSMEEISLLTLHSRPRDPGANVRRYVEEHPSQPEPRLQMAMSSALLRAIGLA